MVIDENIDNHRYIGISILRIYWRIFNLEKNLGDLKLIKTYENIEKNSKWYNK